VTALRPRLEHAQMMTKADMARLGKLGGKYASLHIQHLTDFLLVIASIQPTHAYVLVYIYFHVVPMLFLRSASVTCGMLKIGWFVLLVLSEASLTIFFRGQNVSKVCTHFDRSSIVVQGSLLVPIFPLKR